MNTIKLQKGQIFNSLQCGQFQILEEIKEEIEVKITILKNLKFNFLKQVL